jgi:hypothetical protein
MRLTIVAEVEKCTVAVIQSLERAIEGKMELKIRIVGRLANYCEVGSYILMDVVVKRRWSPYLYPSWMYIGASA